MNHNNSRLGIHTGTGTELQQFSNITQDDIDEIRQYLRAAEGMLDGWRRKLALCREKKRDKRLYSCKRNIGWKKSELENEVNKALQRVVTIRGRLINAENQYNTEQEQAQQSLQTQIMQTDLQQQQTSLQQEQAELEAAEIKKTVMWIGVAVLSVALIVGIIKLLK